MKWIDRFFYHVIPTLTGWLLVAALAMIPTGLFIAVLKWIVGMLR